MGRPPRTIYPGYGVHVVQRGSRRMRTFFNETDCRFFMSLLKTACDKYDVKILAWCLMSNHLHLLLMPSDAQGVSKALQEACRNYSVVINAREDWSGALWQGRFWSVNIVSDAQLIAVARYIERNPIGVLVERAEDWPHSSARAHLDRKEDDYADIWPLLDMVPDWRHLLTEEWPSDKEYTWFEPRRGRPPRRL